MLYMRNYVHFNIDTNMLYNCIFFSVGTTVVRVGQSKSRQQPESYPFCFLLKKRKKYISYVHLVCRVKTWGFTYRG